MYLKGTMQNNSAHATLQQTGGNPSEHVDQQSPTRIYQQVILSNIILNIQLERTSPRKYL